MQALTQVISARFQSALARAFPELADCKPEISPTAQVQFGHYQCNSAMKLANQLKLKPRDLAQTWVDALSSEDQQLFSKIELAGPGFINITLSTQFLTERLQSIANDPHLGIPQLGAHQKYILDYSSPNIAKEMHVGHLRSTIIGDSLARVCEAMGAEVLRLNHMGDFGTAFGMLIAHIQDTFPTASAEDFQATLPELVIWYKESKRRFDEDFVFKKQAQLAVVALQSGHPEVVQFWKKICHISQIAYQEIYELLQVQNLIERGESFYQPLLGPLVQDLSAKGLLIKSDGALCLFVPGFTGREGEPLPLMVEKSDGGYTYATTDLAAVQHRVQIERAQRMIYVVDAGQSQHLQMIFKASEMAGFVDPKQVRLDHVAFGLVLGADGKKFKTRSGETERLIDLLRTGIEEAAEILKTRDSKMSPEQLDTTAKILGINAIKYADLSCQRTADYQFSYERMLRFEGNTAAFLMYAYVRISSIQRKIGRMPAADSTFQLAHPNEIALALHLNTFPDVLVNVFNDLYPHRLCEYLYQLAIQFNAFFRDCRVEGDPQEASRLKLCLLTAEVLKKGMNLLGLQTVEQM